MSDRFRPLSMEQLTDWAFTELEREGSIFGVPHDAVFTPRADHRFRVRDRDVELETPWGVAAGPHTQLAQNIVAAWLVGARTIELKTVQTLDDLVIDRPCIDVEDEGYNVEWSQELKVHESFDEYLRAWVLVHALHDRLGLPGDRPGVRFTMSVGYDLAGIGQPNVQWFLDAMSDASAYLPAYVAIVARRHPGVRAIDIPARISDTVTLSTMHGCPPDEVERIALHLIEERGLHTSVKCNPTLLGADRVRAIVNDDLRYVDVSVPDAAFGHDMRYADAVPIFGRLRRAAEARGLSFGLKLSNTLEVENHRSVFGAAPTMYMSGRALHAVTVNLAAALVDDLPGIPISFAGGADCFNVPDLLAAGMATVTVCSDLLASGGYLRMLQYAETVEAAFDAVGASDTPDFIRRTARAGGHTGDPADLAACARHNLRGYADRVRRDRRYRKDTFRTDRSKTARALGLFDCIAAPCRDVCPIAQDVPGYMAAVRSGDCEEAVRITRRENPLAAVLGRVCDHVCEGVCVRTHLDEPLAIRHVKRFVMEHEPPTRSLPGDGQAVEATAGGPVAAARVAIVGACPAGIAAAEALVRAGIHVTVFEERPYAGGMAGGAIPAYRLPHAQVDQDLARVERLGVEFRYGRRVGRDVTVDGLLAEGYAAVLVAVGAQRPRMLGLPGEDAVGVVDGIALLRGFREGIHVSIGDRVAVVGGGDTAMDCARSARRLGATSVSIVYRRSVDQMPADPEEILAAREEGIGIVEMARPVAVRVRDGHLAGITCIRTAYDGTRDGTGRKAPRDTPGSEFPIDLDTLVLAVSQDAVLDLFGDHLPDLTLAGFVATDPLTFATSLPGVYAAGDVAGHGPASIVRAVADGRRAAGAIAAALGVEWPRSADAHLPPDVHELAVRRARRDYRVPVRTVDPDSRAGSDETVLGYTADEAAREARRCLDCDRMCSLCVGVCPNMALFTYASREARVDLSELAAVGGVATAVGSARFVAGQRLQVAVLADLCNECGNCVTVCPTAGRPFHDKPRLYLRRDDFEAERSNAFMLLGDGVVEGRFDGATHRLTLVTSGAAGAAGVATAAEASEATQASCPPSGAGAAPAGAGRGAARMEYIAPGFRALLEAGTFAVVEAELTGQPDGARISLEPAAVMATLLTGVTESVPHLPIAGSPAGTRIAAPGLAG